MENGFRIRTKFWGVRGSIPTPDEENRGFGGNTPCIEIRSGEDILIIDGGTGARKLAMTLEQEFAERSCNLGFLMTHFHWDHIQGLPLFTPLYSPKNEITFISGLEEDQIQHIFEGQMAFPYFPLDFQSLGAKRHFVQTTSSPARQGSLSIQAFPLNHPQGSNGFRIEKDGAVVVHASDFEHGDPRHDRILRDHAQNADVLIMDAQYTPEEYAQKRGWGHSTWLEAVAVAKACNVKQLILFHHDPSHTDGIMEGIVAAARRHFENTVAATELAVVDV